MVETIPLVMVPGLLCDEMLWAPQSAALADIAECSVAETTLDDSITAMAERILARSPERFALAGLSMGGYIALEVVRIAPERVAKLALLDTSAQPDTPERTAARRELAARATSGPRGFEAVVETHLPTFLHPDRLGDRALCETVRLAALGVGARVYARQMSAIAARRDQRPHLGAIRCRTLVLCGRQDTLTPLALHEELAAGIPGATLSVVEDCGHLATLECPDAVNRALRTWLVGASVENDR